MEKNNILIIGFGSIGKRHLGNILLLGYGNVSVISRTKKNDTEFPFVRFYNTIEESFENNFFDKAFICTPTSYHIKDLILLLHYRVKNIYIEKPLSNSYHRIEDVIKLGLLGQSNIVVGYDLHFDLGIAKVRELIGENVIGRILSANVFVGQHLSQWRPNEDYREGMSAKDETGGGVLLDLIHEFDYLCWLFGDVDFVACDYLNSGELEIETEESANVLLKFESGISATIHLDYLQKKIIRHCIFTGTKGTITWDVVKCWVNWVDKNGTEMGFDYSGMERNDRFIAIIKAFLEHKKDERLTSLNEGLKSLRVVLAAKKSCEDQCFVKVASVAG